MSANTWPRFPILPWGMIPCRVWRRAWPGIYLPPGQVRDKLMVYDLNRICDDPSKGREIPVPAGENFQSLILHKVIVGGDPTDPADRALYPGCILINLPRLKVHAQALFTNVIKNLGIGLYPMEVSRSDGCAWEYATPHRAIPGMKGGIPHQVWVPEMDPATCLPKRDSDGSYKVKKTGGLTGTMLDIIAAVADQDIFMLHIVDAVEGINRDHQGIGLGVKVPDGLVMAGMDPVATDLCCARYMFSNVGLKEAEESGLDDGTGGRFPQAVPMPRFDGKAIMTARRIRLPAEPGCLFRPGGKTRTREALLLCDRPGWDNGSAHGLLPGTDRIGRRGNLPGDFHQSPLFRHLQDALGPAEDLFRLSLRRRPIRRPLFKDCFS